MCASNSRSPGRSRKKPLKPLRSGMPGDFRCDRCEYSCAFLLPIRTRGCGCTGHPAFPTPSFGRKIHQRLGRVARRELFSCLETVIARAAKQSILSLRGEMDCFAELAMTALGDSG